MPETIGPILKRSEIYFVYEVQSYKTYRVSPSVKRFDPCLLRSWIQITVFDFRPTPNMSTFYMTTTLTSVDVNAKRNEKYQLQDKQQALTKLVRTATSGTIGRESNQFAASRLR